MNKLRASDLEAKKRSKPRESSISPVKTFVHASAQESSFPTDTRRSQQSFDFSQTRTQFSTMGIQARLTINAPGDIYEHEADAIARQVATQQSMGHLDGNHGYAIAPVAVQHRVQRASDDSSFPEDAEEQLRQIQAGGNQDEEVQRKGTEPITAPATLASQLSTMAQSGQALSGETRARMENGFNADFSHVRIHTDSQAARVSRSIGAEAFTYGNDIYFGQNKFSDSSYGTELLAHELTHTIQQKGLQRRAIQRRGGAKVGTLRVRADRMSGAMIDGHAWLSYTPVGGTETTYGTWGNRGRPGLYRDLELGRAFSSERATDLDAADYGNLTSFATANDTWGYLQNCAWFAARGWRAVTGESLSYQTAGFIPNPNALADGIDAVGGGVLAAAPAAAGGSSSGGSSL